MVKVPWWPDALGTFTGGERLAHLRVYYDFNWFSVFGHAMGQFPHGQSLGRLVKRDCPEGLTPALLLTTRSDVDEPWIETDDKKLVVVVPIHDYLAHSEPDPAASYYASRYGPGLTAAKNAQFLAQQHAVVKAVVESGLTIEDIARWTELAEGRMDQLRALAAVENANVPAATPELVVGVLRELDGLDAEIVDALATLLGEGDANDREAKLRLLDNLLRVSLADEESQDIFLRNNRDFLAAILQSSVDAPDIVALAHRREVLTTFEGLLSDDAFFDGEMKRLKLSRERVWQRFLEESPWLIGSTLAPQFLHSWSKERLEQTVVGSSVAGPGKRPDALLRTAGAVSAVVFAEIKHHRTQLLKTEYRPGSWSVTEEVVGGVAQCQATVDEAQAFLGRSIDIKDDEGYVTGHAFICRPRSLLVVGSLTEFTKEDAVHKTKFESFERFRRSLRDPEILTFDELFERARLTLELDTASQSTQ